MTLRIATASDIPAMQVIRRAVTENRLSDPRKVTDEHCREMLQERGRGWVVERDGQIEGFGMADALARSIWALFVKPGCEGRGVGRALHDAMVEWLFEVGDTPLWLSTEPSTRAERFYGAAGWTAERLLPGGEIHFVLNERPAQKG